MREIQREREGERGQGRNTQISRVTNETQREKKRERGKKRGREIDIDR